MKRDPPVRFFLFIFDPICWKRFGVREGLYLFSPVPLSVSIPFPEHETTNETCACVHHPPPSAQKACQESRKASLSNFWRFLRSPPSSPQGTWNAISPPRKRCQQKIFGPNLMVPPSRHREQEIGSCIILFWFSLDRFSQQNFSPASFFSCKSEELRSQWRLRLIRLKWWKKGFLQKGRFHQKMFSLFAASPFCEMHTPRNNHISHRLTSTSRTKQKRELVYLIKI